MIVVNPVLRRELIERWRSRRAVVTLTVYLGVLGLVCYSLYRVGISVLTSMFGFGPDPATAGPLLGRFLVEGLLFFVLLLVLFVAPGYAAAQLSGERERRTLSLLQATLLRPREIVLGKLGASTAWLSLLVLAALPLGAAAFFLGGLALGDLLRGILTIVVLGVGISAIAIGISSLTKRTTASIVLTYAVVLGLTLGTLFAAGVEAVLRSRDTAEVRTPIAMYANPFFALADGVNAQRPSSMMSGGLPSPLGLMAEMLPGAPLMRGGVEEAFVEEAIDSGGAFEGDAVLAAPVDDPVGGGGEQPVWLIVSGLYLVAGGLALALASRRLRVVEPRARAMTATRQPAVAPPPP